MFEENLLVMSIRFCLLMNCIFHLVTVVQLLSYACLYNPMDCGTPGFPVLHQPWSLLKFMSFESVKPSNHLILCRRLHPAAAAAKSLQLCPTLCDPIDGSLPGSPVPGILQARTLEWVAISFSNA